MSFLAQASGPRKEELDRQGGAAPERPAATVHLPRGGHREGGLQAEGFPAYAPNLVLTRGVMARGQHSLQQENNLESFGRRGLNQVALMSLHGPTN